MCLVPKKLSRTYQAQDAQLQIAFYQAAWNNLLQDNGWDWHLHLLEHLKCEQCLGTGPSRAEKQRYQLRLLVNRKDL